VNAADSFSWRIDVTNNGPSTATNVQVTDTLPSGVAFASASGGGFSCGFNGSTVSCSRSSLAAGSTRTLYLYVNAPDEGGPINNCAYASTSAVDPVSSNNSDCHLTNVNSVSDVSMVKTGPGSINAGGQFF